MSPSRALVAALLALSLSACGGSENEEEPDVDAAPPAELTEPTEPAAEPTPTRASAGPGTNCEDAAGDGGAVDLTNVRVERQGDDVTVIWTTQAATPPKGTVLYSLTASNQDGSATRQYAVKYQDGEQVGYFVDAADSPQEDLEGQVPSGLSINAPFPVGDLDDTFVYRATTSLDGTEVDACPDGQETITFNP